MSALFNHVAKDYDVQFTHSKIGHLQRQQVLGELHKIITKNSTVLELNCGTGEDALWLADMVKSVLATDVSAEMIAVATEKTRAKANVSCAILDLTQMDDALPNTFDILFSNFGGLNCLNPTELETFLQKSAALLNKKGALVLVIMGKKTLWEFLYFGLKIDFKNATRRNTTQAVAAHVNGVYVPTWYYSPNDVSRLAAKHFKIKNIRPIGLFVPPSYLEKFFNSRVLGLRFLSFLDRFRPSACANFADHFLIHLENKTS